MTLFLLFIGIPLFTYIFTFKSDFEDTDLSKIFAAIVTIIILVIVLQLF